MTPSHGPAVISLRTAHCAVSPKLEELAPHPAFDATVFSSWPWTLESDSRDARFGGPVVFGDGDEDPTGLLAALDDFGAETHTMVHRDCLPHSYRLERPSFGGLPTTKLAQIAQVSRLSRERMRWEDIHARINLPRASPPSRKSQAVCLSCGRMSLASQHGS